jgi:endogenous inhibitor of DNA gyrase (YacG/DUF329 family)
MTVLAKKSKSRKCPECSGQFETYNYSQKYCKFDCAKAAKRASTLKKTAKATVANKEKFKKEHGSTTGLMLLKCKQCKKRYERQASNVKHRGSNYCSNECKHLGKKLDRSKSSLVRELDALYSKYIRNKHSTDGKTVQCVTCGKVDEISSMQNGHYVSRRFHSTRWVDKNCHPQCYSCNVGLGGNYARYSHFMIRTYGQEVIEELIEMSNKTSDFSKTDILEKIDFYKAHLKEQLG